MVASWPYLTYAGKTGIHRCCSGGNTQNENTYATKQQRTVIRAHNPGLNVERIGRTEQRRGATP
eukprot:11134021-Lingulodinium_polyedra.AAC.1